MSNQLIACRLLHEHTLTHTYTYILPCSVTSIPALQVMLVCLSAAFDLRVERDMQQKCCLRQTAAALVASSWERGEAATAMGCKILATSFN